MNTQTTSAEESAVVNLCDLSNVFNTSAAIFDNFISLRTRLKEMMEDDDLLNLEVDDLFGLIAENNATLNRLAYSAMSGGK